MCEGNCNNIECDNYDPMVKDNCNTYDTGKLKGMCDFFTPEGDHIIYAAVVRLKKATHEAEINLSNMFGVNGPAASKIMREYAEATKALFEMV